MSKTCEHYPKTRHRVAHGVIACECGHVFVYVAKSDESGRYVRVEEMTDEDRKNVSADKEYLRALDLVEFLEMVDETS